MKKVRLMGIGLIPIVFGIFFVIIGYFIENRLFLGLMSLSFLLLWGYVGYEIGKEESLSFKNIIFFSHLIPTLIIVLQILGMVFSIVTDNYNPTYISQLFFLPVVNLIFDLFFITLEKAVLISYIIMIIVFGIGISKAK